MSPHPIHAGARRLAEIKQLCLYVLLVVAAAPVAGSLVAIVILKVTR